MLSVSKLEKRRIPWGVLFVMFVRRTTRKNKYSNTEVCFENENKKSC